MMYIPKELMLSLEVACNCPVVGNVISEMASIFAHDEDKSIALYMMSECTRGKDSFWYPYFNIIGKPMSVSDWSEVELNELQCETMKEEAQQRKPFIFNMYNSMMEALCSTYPDTFSRDKHTFELFDWSWRHIQARAFGRRLPWTSLVPLADMLNHANVPTLYSYNADTFTLFPSQDNNYKAGKEVFNSYGRRSNRFLLIEYGFAMVSIILSRHA